METHPLSWAERQAELLAFADKQMFFVGGAPRSGTTWLQSLLDAHPDVSCRGEALFFQKLATPLDELVRRRKEAIAEKNERIFKHAAGYPLPEGDLADQMLGTGILLSLQKQCDGRSVRAVGEKTPENAFFFPRLSCLFPRAKFIAIARDPRDVIASAWHFFPRPRAADAAEEDAAKTAFIEFALPSLVDGTRSILDFGDRRTGDLIVVTYEALKQAPQLAVARLFEFLGVAADVATVASCVQKASFEAMTSGRSPGAVVDGSFFRSGVAGGWRSVLTAAMSDRILRDVGWAFPRFGWRA